MRRLCWLGIATTAYDETVRLARDVLGMHIEFEEQSTAEFSLPSGDRVQIFAPGHPYFDFFSVQAQGPVALFEVDDVVRARSELEAAGVALVGGIEHDDEWDWLNFRGPDGNLYELAARRSAAGERAGAHIQTLSGTRVDPFKPDAGAIEVEDIAGALAKLCRFGGHCRVFYSVAQHSCIVADVVAAQTDDESVRLFALLHDAAEAYLGDLPHPIKHRSELGALYRAAEARLQVAIYRRFSVPVEPQPLVEEIDRAVLAAERLALMRDSWAWPELEGVDPAPIQIEPWPPSRAADEFLERYERLVSSRCG